MTDNNLQRLQNSFQAYILNGEPDVLAAISNDVRPSAAARLAIYAHGYRLRLIEVLTSDFPALHTLAGDELFEQISRAYIDAHPSRHYSVRYFGQHLGTFLATTAPYSESGVLSDMARLEWALSLAFDAADAPMLDVDTLAKLPPERWPDMRLRFHPSVQRHDFRCNVPELWSAIDQHSAPQAPETYTQARAWLIWRRDLQNYFRPLETIEAIALDCMRNDSCFATMCENLCEHMDTAQVVLRAAGYLKGWIRTGLISELC